jgi:hypothetical protein
LRWLLNSTLLENVPATQWLTVLLFSAQKSYMSAGGRALSLLMLPVPSLPAVQVEDAELQARARALLPLDALRREAQEAAELNALLGEQAAAGGVAGLDDFLVQGLLAFFKRDFFSWVRGWGAGSAAGQRGRDTAELDASVTWSNRPCASIQYANSCCSCSCGEAHASCTTASSSCFVPTVCASMWQLHVGGVSLRVHHRLLLLSSHSPRYIVLLCAAAGGPACMRAVHLPHHWHRLGAANSS